MERPKKSSASGAIGEAIKIPAGIDNATLTVLLLVEDAGGRQIMMKSFLVVVPPGAKAPAP